MNWKKHLLAQDKNREGGFKNSGELKKSVEPQPGTAPGQRNNERPGEFCGISVTLGLTPGKMPGEILEFTGFAQQILLRVGCNNPNNSNQRRGGTVLIPQQHPASRFSHYWVFFWHFSGSVPCSQHSCPALPGSSRTRPQRETAAAHETGNCY